MTLCTTTRTGKNDAMSLGGGRLKRLYREINILFLDSLSSRVHCEPASLPRQMRDILFSTLHQSNSTVMTDTLCSILFSNSYNCSYR